MKPLKFSSSQDSEVNQARLNYWLARYQFGQARRPDTNYSFGAASSAMARAKRKLKEVAYAARGVKYQPTKKYELEDYAYVKYRVNGIPCCLVATHYVPAEPASWCEPPVVAEVEWVLTDDRGYRMEWLEKKMGALARAHAEDVLLQYLV